MFLCYFVSHCTLLSFYLYSLSSKEDRSEVTQLIRLLHFSKDASRFILNTRRSLRGQVALKCWCSASISVAWIKKEYRYFPRMGRQSNMGYPSVLCRLSHNSSPVNIYTPARRETLWKQSVLRKGTSRLTQLGLELRLLRPESSALCARPPRFP